MSKPRVTPSVHPIREDEIHALRKLRRESATQAYVFVTERGGPMSTIHKFGDRPQVRVFNFENCSRLVMFFLEDGHLRKW